MTDVTLANIDDVVHFEKGMTLTIPFGETTRRVGKAVVTEIRRTTGTFTISHFADCLKELYPEDAVRAITYDGNPLFDVLPRVTPLECGIAAAVALGGLGWIIARRNALAGTEEVSESWIRAACEWLAALVRGMFSAPPKEPEHGR